MKTFPIAGAALALATTGAAFAQHANKTATGIGSVSSTSGGGNAPVDPSASFNQDTKPNRTSIKTPTPSDDSNAHSNTMPMSSSDSMQNGAMSGSSMSGGSMSSGSMSNGSMVGDMSQSNPPPAAGAYPRCTHKGQDRCTTMAHKTIRRKAAAGA